MLFGFCTYGMQFCYLLRVDTRGKCAQTSHMHTIIYQSFENQIFKCYTFFFAPYAFENFQITMRLSMCHSFFFSISAWAIKCCGAEPWTITRLIITHCEWRNARCTMPFTKQKKLHFSQKEMNIRLMWTETLLCEGERETQNERKSWQLFFFYTKSTSSNHHRYLLILDVRCCSASLLLLLSLLTAFLN